MSRVHHHLRPALLVRGQQELYGRCQRSGQQLVALHFVSGRAAPTASTGDGRCWCSTARSDRARLRTCPRPSRAACPECPERVSTDSLDGQALVVWFTNTVTLAEAALDAGDGRREDGHTCGLSSSRRLGPAPETPGSVGTGRRRGPASLCPRTKPTGIGTAGPGTRCRRRRSRQRDRICGPGHLDSARCPLRAAANPGQPDARPQRGTLLGVLTSRSAPPFPAWPPRVQRELADRQASRGNR